MSPSPCGNGRPISHLKRGCGVSASRPPSGVVPRRTRHRSHAKAAGLYMICTLSKHDAEAKGYDDALMLDYRGRIAESTGANIFLIQDGKIHTPTPDCFLDGITRRTVISIAKKHGYEVIERAIMPEETCQHVRDFSSPARPAEVNPCRRVRRLQIRSRHDHAHPAGRLRCAGARHAERRSGLRGRFRPIDIGHPRPCAGTQRCRLPSGVGLLRLDPGTRPG